MAKRRSSKGGLLSLKTLFFAALIIATYNVIQNKGFPTSFNIGGVVDWVRGILNF